MPWDDSHVLYVWIDALLNYATAAGYGTDPERFARLWPADVHLMSRDILRFHAVIWPAMLMAAGLEPPRKVFAHGWLLVGGVANAVPALPPGSRVRVGGLVVPAEQVSAAVGNAMQAEVLRAGLIAFPLVVVAAGVVSWWLVGRVLSPLHAVTATARRLSAESLDTRLALRDAAFKDLDSLVDALAGNVDPATVPGLTSPALH